MTPAVPTWSGSAACRVTGLTYRMLDYLARTGTVTPTVGAAGSGSQRGYSVEDIVWLQVHRTLADLHGGTSSLALLRRLRAAGGRIQQDGVLVDVNLHLVRARVIGALRDVPPQDQQPDVRVVVGRRALPPQLARAGGGRRG